MCSLNKITVAARDSALSKRQVEEVLNELRKVYDIDFCPLYVKTKGDLDKKTSLRTLEKTDFFTKEIDDIVLKGICRIGIHSAKDLPDPIPSRLRVICLTKGLAASDALVLREGVSFYSLPQKALIGTSSARREETVRALRADLLFCDLRGTIEERLQKLENGEIDGIVVAECALIRLGLTHLNRVILDGETAKGQGRLAVVAREEDKEMKDLFACIDSRC